MKAVFIDKDGTLLTNVPFNVDPLLVSFEKYVIDGLKMLDRHGYKKIIISNQPGIALGYFDEPALDTLNSKINLLLAEQNTNIDSFYYCPHSPAGQIPQYAMECKCRKPLPGLIQQAAHELNIELKNSWMIGDILNDIEAGKTAGCSTILVDNGGETEWMVNKRRIPDYIVDDFLQAAQIICKE